MVAVAMRMRWWDQRRQPVYVGEHERCVYTIDRGRLKGDPVFCTEPLGEAHT